MSLALALFLVSVSLHGAPSHFSYQGQIVKPNGAPLEASSVLFTIDVLSHGAERCLLYQERHTVNMTNSNGIFAIEVGSGVRSGTDYEDTNTLANALSNSTGLVTPTTCASVGTYNPSATHGRKLRVTFNDGSGSVTLSQLHNIVSVPYATNASTIDGLTVGDLLTINTSGTYVLTQANLENLFDTPNHNELLALIAGTSTHYLQATPSADFDMNSNKIVNVDTPTAGTDAANKNYVDANLGGMTLDTADIQALAVGNAGEVLTWNGTQWVSQTVSSTDATKLPLAGGTMSGPIDMGSEDITDIGNITNVGSITNVGNITTTNDVTFGNNAGVANNLSAGGNLTVASNATIGNDLAVANDLTVTNNVSITGGIGVGTGINSGGTISLTNGSEINFRDADDSNFVGFAAPAIVGADLVWTLPAADGTPNQVLQTDGSGMLNWVSLPTGGETNTASNVGAGGVAVYKQKTGVDFEFKSINAGSNKVTITNDAGNNEIDINVDEAQFALGTIPNTPAGNIAATNAQAAINELDTEKVERSGDTMTGALNIDNEQEIRLSENDANGTEYVGFKAPAAVGANAIWTLPAADGTVGQVLRTDGAGVLSWVSQTSGADNLGNHTATADLGMANFSILNLEGGSASAPGLSFNGDANTGLFSGGSDTLSLATAGNEVLTISAAGNVGIGAAPSSSLLEVNKNHNGSTILMVNNPNAGAAAIAEVGLSNDVGLNGGLYQTSSNYLPATFSNQTILEGNGAGVILWSSSGNIKMYAGSQHLSDEKLTIAPSGNIGISDSNPGARLSMTAPALNKTYPSPGTGKGSFHIDPESTADGLSNAITFGANDGASPRQSAQAGIYVQSSAAYGTIMHLATTDNYGTGAKVQMTISPEGSVGVGTTNPGQKLDVEGTILSGPKGTSAGDGGSIVFEELAASAGSDHVGFRAPDNVTTSVIWELPAADGTVGQVLQTNGVGVLSWVTQTSGADDMGDHTATMDLDMANSSILDLEGGSAAAPGLSFNADSNTGLYSSGGDNVGLATAGTARLHINASGDIGIGTDNPAVKLDVVGSTSVVGHTMVTGASTLFVWDDTVYAPSGATHRPGVESFMTIENTDTTPGNIALLNLSSKNGTGLNNAYIGSVSGAAGYTPTIVVGAQTGAATYAERMRIDASGNMGVGTSGPNAKLDVEGRIISGPQGTTAGEGGSIAFEELTANGTASVGFRAPDDVTTGVIWQLPAADGTTGHVLQTNGAGVLSWVAQPSGADNLGNHTATTDLGMADNSILNLEGGSAAAPGLSFNSDANTGLFSAGADSLSLSTAGNEVLTITPAGDVGIGTAGPTDEVQIVKNQNSTTYLSIANTDTGANAESGYGVANDSGDIGYLFTTSSNYVTHHYRNRLSLFADETNANGINIVAGKTTADIRFYTGGITDSEERVRLTAQGNLGIGTAVPDKKLHVVGSNETVRAEVKNLSSTVAQYPGVEIQNYAGATSGSPVVSYTNFRGDASISAPLASGDNLGSFEFWGGSDTTHGSVQGAAIIARAADAFTPSSGTTDIIFATTQSGQIWPDEKVRIRSNGDVGIGLQNPRTTLDVNGAISAAPAVVDTAGTVDFAGSNFAYTSSNCGAFILHNMKDGATYTFAVQGTAVQTCSFTAFSGAGTGALNVRMPPGHGPTTTLTETLYSFVVIGSKVYVSWVPGY